MRMIPSIRTSRRWLRRDARRDARALADRGLHRAEELRDALPEPSELLSELRGQAQPVVEAAREQANRVRPHRRRSRKPIVIAAVLALGALVAFVILSRRDKEPAILMQAPEPPLAPPTDEPGPDATDEPSAPSDASTTTNGVGYRSSEPVVAPTAQSTASTPATSTGTTYGSDRPSTNGSYGGVQPRAQAAWDLPSSGGAQATR